MIVVLTAVRKSITRFLKLMHGIFLPRTMPGTTVGIDLGPQLEPSDTASGWKPAARTVSRVFLFSLRNHPLERRVIFESEQSIGCIVVANRAGCQPEAPPPGPIDADGVDPSTGRSPEAGASGIRSRSGSKPQAIASLVAKLDTEQPGLSFTTLRSVRLQKNFAGHQALCLFAHLR